MLNGLRDAENAYKAALKLEPDDSESTNNPPLSIYSQRKFSDAERQLRKALERSPDNNLMRLNLRASRYARENSRRLAKMAASVSASNPILIEKREGDLLQLLILMPPKDLEAATLYEKRGDSFSPAKCMKTPSSNTENRSHWTDITLRR